MQIVSGNLVIEKTRVACSGGLGHFDDHIDEWFIAGELADAAAKLVAGFESNKTAEMSGKVGVIRFDYWQAFACDNGLDGIACDL